MNSIEFLLFLSAKKLGVNFYFDEKFDYLLLNNSLVDLVFDASGGKIPYTKQKASTEEKLKIEIPNLNMNFNYAGVKKLPVPDADSNERISVTLKRHGTITIPNLKEAAYPCR